MADQQVRIVERIGAERLDPALPHPFSIEPESMMRCATWMFFGPSSRAIAWATARRPNLALANAA